MLANAWRVLALTAALSLVGSVHATPAGKEGPRKETPAETLRKQLDYSITLELTDTPLANVLVQLSDMAKVQIILDRNIVMSTADPSEMLVSLKAKDTPLRTALRAITSQHALTFAIVGDHILVSSEEVVNYRQLHQRVSIDCDGEELSKLLKDLAARTVTNLVIDPKSQKAANETKLTLRLDDVPLETAVRLMAEMGGLKPVRLGNVLFITSEDRAEKLKAEGEAPAPPPANGAIGVPQVVPAPQILPNVPGGMPAIPGGGGMARNVPHRLMDTPGPRVAMRWLRTPIRSVAQCLIQTPLYVIAHRFD